MVRNRLAWILVFLTTTALGESPKTVRDLAAGPPKLMSGPLDPAAYKKMTAQALSNPEVLYFNFNWAAENGIQVPPEGATPEFLKEIAEAFGYQIPDPKDPKEAFTEKKIDVYADGYGADDTVNLGSGRAASFGSVQSKGIGRTLLVRDSDPWHSNGAFLFVDGSKEGLDGEVVHNDVIFGGNRMIAILATGTYTTLPNGQTVPRIVAIRADELRPAQFIKNNAVKSADDRAWDDKRVAKVGRKLVDFLPQPKGQANLDPGPRLTAGLQEFADRLALRYADAWVMRLHHGGESVSNVMMDAGMIDFFTLTGLNGWPKYLTDHRGKPFGDVSEASRWIIEEWVNNLHKSLPEDLKPFLPEATALSKRFEEAYAKALPERMLRLTGAPDEFLEKVGTTANARELGRLLVQLAQAGNTEIYRSHDQFIPEDLGKFDVSAVLRALASHEPLTEKLVSDPSLRTQLAEKYAKYLEELNTWAVPLGINERNLSTFMVERSAMLTRKVPGTYATKQNEERLQGLWRKYTKDKDRAALQRAFDELIDTNTRNFKDRRPFEIVVHQRSDTELGQAVRTVYDLKQGKYFQVFRFADRSGHINFFGTVLPRSQLEGSALHFSTEPPGLARRGVSEKRGAFYEYRVPVANAVFEPGTVTLSTQDGQTIAPREPALVRRLIPDRPGCVEATRKIGSPG